MAPYRHRKQADVKVTGVLAVRRKSIEDVLSSMPGTLISDGKRLRTSINFQDGTTICDEWTRMDPKRLEILNSVLRDQADLRSYFCPARARSSGEEESLWEQGKLILTWEEKTSAKGTTSDSSFMASQSDLPQVRVLHIDGQLRTDSAINSTEITFRDRNGLVTVHETGNRIRLFPNDDSSFVLRAWLQDEVVSAVEPSSQPDITHLDKDYLDHIRALRPVADWNSSTPCPNNDDEEQIAE